MEMGTGRQVARSAVGGSCRALVTAGGSPRQAGMGVLVGAGSVMMGLGEGDGAC